MKVRAPNGQNLSVEGNPWPFIGRWAFISWLFGQGGGLRFNVTPAGSAELITRELGDWPRFKVREASWNSRAGSGLQQGKRLATNVIDQLCSVQIKPVADVAEDIPRSKGKQVRGGSMWRFDDVDEKGALRTREAFVVNDSTATSIITYEPEDPKFISVAGSLTCALSN